MNTPHDFKVRNLPEQLADHIVAMLAQGELSAGQRLIEKDLCGQLGVSRVPLREALRLLQAQGVVHTEPNRGNYLADFSADAMIEIADIRVTIEKRSFGRLAMEQQENNSQLAFLRASLKDMERAAANEDILESCKADLNFHSAVLHRSGSNVLVPIWETLSRGVLVFLVKERKEGFDYVSWLADHQRLIDLTEAGKITALEQEITKHIMNGLTTSP